MKKPVSLNTSNLQSKYGVYSSPRDIGEKPGFALVVTLSLMILLTIIAVGLLGLSSISLRQSNASDPMNQARANARMALIMAIGELQKSLGPDQRVSARSSVVNGDEGEPNALGVWRSWRWDPEGTEVADYGKKSGRFLRWLASSPNPDAATQREFASLPIEDPVWLINPDTVGLPTNGDDVGSGLRGGRVPVSVGRTLGAFAYAVMDEAQKAPVHLQHDDDLAPVDLVAMRTAPHRAAVEVLVPELNPKAGVDPEKLISLNTAVMATGADKVGEVVGRQQSLTAGSVGLLTDVANGGLRTDLTTLFEGTTNLENVLGQETLYLRGDDGAPRWDYLRSHYQLHRQVSGSRTGQPKVRIDRGDLIPNRFGIQTALTNARLLPVIAKFQVMFSIVTHHHHISDRVAFFNNSANPRGNQRYAAPHLVYDPVITLWNPYDVAIDLNRLRVRVWDPPVAFAFQKNGKWLRQEHAIGQYHSLARFTYVDQTNPNARRYFTMSLKDMAVNGRPGNKILLQPGEVKIFSPWVESNWTWGLETSNEWNPRAFFDWNTTLNLGNTDKRTNNNFGVETVPGWDPRAGLQTDHISYHSIRPNDTKYPFELENPVYGNQGWLAIKLEDELSVFARPERTVPKTGQMASIPDFQIDLLAGNVEDPKRDILRSYQFRFDNVASEIGWGLNGSDISRTFTVGDLLQTPSDRSPGGKTPFATLTLSAKTTVDRLDSSKPWVYGNPVHEGGEQDTRFVGNALNTYDLRFEEVQDFNTFPGIEIDPESNRGFFGASGTANRGVTLVPMFHVPVIPASSLGDLVSANLIAGASLPRVTHAFGNSRANPLLASNAVVRSPLIQGTTVKFGKMSDHSFLINDALWDAFYFSTIASYRNELAGNASRSDLLDAFLNGKPEPRLLNPRLVALVEPGNPASVEASRLNALLDAELCRQMAAVMGINGAFNVNSDSVDAWRAFLSSARNRAIPGWNQTSFGRPDHTPFSRHGFALAGDDPAAAGGNLIDVEGQIRWAGFRSLSDTEITTLAERIVDEIRKRGREDAAPSLTIGEFVNRRMGSPGGLHVLKGLLQTAIDTSEINDTSETLDSRLVDANTAVGPNATKGEATPEARLGHTAEGAPSLLTQGDLMMALAPVVAVRGDTFRIRAYGEAKDSDGRPLAKAWCEAVVQRIPGFVDTSQVSHTNMVDLNVLNQSFGRRFVLQSFRWLSPNEI